MGKGALRPGRRLDLFAWYNDRISTERPRQVILMPFFLALGIATIPVCAVTLLDYIHQARGRPRVQILASVAFVLFYLFCVAGAGLGYQLVVNDWLVYELAYLIRPEICFPLVRLYVDRVLPLPDMHAALPSLLFDYCYLYW